MMIKLTTMARIVYNEGVEPLKGIYCGIQYYVRNGMGLCFAQHLPTAKEAKKSPAKRAERITKLCVKHIQAQMHDMRKAMQQYDAIMKRVKRLYDELHELERGEDKLIEKIMEAYYQNRRVLPSRKVELPRIFFEDHENGSSMVRECSDYGSTRSAVSKEKLTK